MEIWKDIEHYNGVYQISNLGRVRSFNSTGSNSSRRKTPIIMKNIKDSKGYEVVNLSKNGSKKMKKIHRLIAKAFIPNPDRKEFVNHIDGNPSNNSICNLEWATSSENKKHGYDIGITKPVMGSKHGRSKLTESDVLTIRDLHKRKIYSNIKIAEIFGISANYIGEIIRRDKWKHI